MTPLCLRYAAAIAAQQQAYMQAMYMQVSELTREWILTSKHAHTFPVSRHEHIAHPHFVTSRTTAATFIVVIFSAIINVACSSWRPPPTGLLDLIEYSTCSCLRIQIHLRQLNSRILQHFNRRYVDDNGQLLQVTTHKKLLCFVKKRWLFFSAHDGSGWHSPRCLRWLKRW